MVDMGDPFNGHVLSRVPRDIAEADSMTLAAHLRHLVACKHADMEPEQLLNEIRFFSMLERQGEWQDLWSP
eukprot:10425766-Karenia_brevis.AAC.1